jgi:hypothetical protein
MRVSDRFWVVSVDRSGRRSLANRLFRAEALGPHQLRREMHPASDIAGASGVGPERRAGGAYEIDAICTRFRTIAQCRGREFKPPVR